MRVINYDYIQEISAEDALKNSASDVTSWYNWGIPWVNTFKINAETSVYNEQWWDWQWIAWWSTDISWTATDYNTVSWGSWKIYLPDWTELSVTSWNTGNMSTVTYIYYDRSDDTVKTTTTAADSVWEDKIVICVAAPTTSWKNAEFQAFGTNAQSTFITADNIAANTITGNEIQANSIWTNQIQAYSITAWKIDVSRLSDIDPDLWSITAGNITGTTITAGSTSSSAIKLYPYSSTQWRIDFYYSWSVIGYMYWDYVSAAGWWLIRIHWNNILLDWTTYMISRNTLDLSQGKLRIPVWTNVY